MSSPRCATLFGGSGFLGRAIAQELAREGVVVRVPMRHPDRAAALRIAGEAGQIAPFPCSLRRDAEVAEAIGGSDTVVNLIGILAGRSASAFQSIHVELAARIARIAKQQGAQNLLHISALGAEPSSKSCCACSKAAGEKAVRAFFPEAIIFRPSIMFGPDDKFLNRFARMARFSPVLPLIGGGQTKFQPVYVGDVARAALAALKNPETRGQTYELGGPSVYTFRELLELVLKTAGMRRGFVNLP
ncbi:MAG: complex I NDUFA9 subunit family protein, partial [Alphaproteobacteria bacterium]|nr:complex I NDUFA9 subunit family protein [Alphaproteobacteria bacterium]